MQTQPRLLIHSILIGIAIALIPFDFIAFNLIPCTLTNALDISILKLPWIQSALLVSMLFFSGLFFQIAETKKSKSLLLLGLLIYAAGSLFVLGRPSYTWIIIARLTQGLGFSMILPASIKLLDFEAPSLAYKVFGISVLAVFFISPWIASAILSNLSLSWLFYFPSFAALLILVLIALFVRFDAPESRKLDPMGFLLIGSSMAILILSLAVGLFWGWGLSSLFFFLSFLAFNLTFFVEESDEYPLFELELFKDRAFLSCMIPLLFIQFAIWPTLFFIPIYLQYFLGLPIHSIGLWFFILTGAVCIGRLLSVRGYAKGYVRLNIGLALSLMTLAFFLLSFLTEQGQRGYLLSCLALLGLGWGFLFLNVYSGSVSLFPKKLAKRGFAFAEIFPFFFGALGLSIGFNLFIRKFNTLFYNQLSQRSLSFPIDINPHFFKVLTHTHNYPEGIQEAFQYAFLESFTAVMVYLSWIGGAALIFSLIFVPARSKEVFSNEDTTSN